jgi:uncharacterized membrane protein
MSNPRFARNVYLLLAVVLAVQVLVYYPQLPDWMASHFDAAGAPNARMPKESFLLLFCGILLGTSALLALGVPALIASKADMVNLPNKGYWLAPERREATLQFLKAHFTWLGSAILALGIVVLYLVAEFHLRHQAALPSDAMWGTLILFFCFVMYWIGRMFWRLSLPS